MIVNIVLILLLSGSECLADQQAAWFTRFSADSETLFGCIVATLFRSECLSLKWRQLNIDHLLDTRQFAIFRDNIHC